MSLLASLRQRMYPEEFRIATVDWPSDLVAALEGLAQADSRPSLPAAAGEDRIDDKAWTRLLVDVGTGLWRARQRMLQPGTDQPLDEMRRPFRHLQSVWDALAEAGIEILDHTGAPFDSGLALNVLSFQFTPGIDRERVVETIKPTIYHKEQPVQMGEVIVGTPKPPSVRQDGMDSQTEGAIQT